MSSQRHAGPHQRSEFLRRTRGEEVFTYPAVVHVRPAGAGAVLDQDRDSGQSMHPRSVVWKSTHGDEVFALPDVGHASPSEVRAVVSAVAAPPLVDSPVTASSTVGAARDQHGDDMTLDHVTLNVEAESVSRGSNSNGVKSSGGSKVQARMPPPQSLQTPRAQFQTVTVAIEPRDEDPRNLAVRLCNVIS